MRQPKIAAARDLRIPNVAITPSPTRIELLILYQDESQTWKIKLGEPSILDYSPILLDSTESKSFPVRIPRLGIPTSDLTDFNVGPTEGKRFISQKSLEVIGPPSFPRSYTPTWRGEALAATDVPERTDLLRPMLEPSVFIAELEHLILPDSLRNEQLEAVYALLNRNAILLADEPGLGKTVVACVALVALFQQGQVQRALVVSPESGRRHWAGHLTTWAHELLVTAVRGDEAQRALDWETAAHLYLTDYQTLATDIEGGILPEEQRKFDVVVLDGIHTISFAERKISQALESLDTGRRWALAGALPQEIEDWFLIFSFLTPKESKVSKDDTLPALRKRFMPNVLRRRKKDLAKDMPRLIRQEIWLDLEMQHSLAYQEALEEERERLEKLGRSVTRTHINAAVDRLKRVCNFAPELLDGAKVRVLIDLVEEITAAGAKLVVLSQYAEDGLDQLLPILEAYGTLRLDTDEPEERQDELLAAFLEDTIWSVLLAEAEVRIEGGPLSEASYVVHFDHGWNPAIRRKTEKRLYPRRAEALPLNVYEFWIADTIDEKLHALLAKRNMLSGQVAEDTQPRDLEEGISIEEWLRDVFEISVPSSLAPAEEPSPIDTGQLPGTSILRTQLASLSSGDLMIEIKLLMEAFGYPSSEILGDREGSDGDLLAWREGEEGIERVLVRCIRSEKNVGVGEGRKLLQAMEDRGDCLSAYLIALTDFTPAGRKLSEESKGRLELISGSELNRTMHVLGRV